MRGGPPLLLAEANALDAEDARRTKAIGQGKVDLLARFLAVRIGGPRLPPPIGEGEGLPAGGPEPPGEGVEAAAAPVQVEAPVCPKSVPHDAFCPRSPPGTRDGVVAALGRADPSSPLPLLSTSH